MSVFFKYVMHEIAFGKGKLMNRGNKCSLINLIRSYSLLSRKYTWGIIFIHFK